ncbi:unnamed protein product, partial [Thlaspi arvense]
MNHKASTRYSNRRDFGVERQDSFAADIVPRRHYAPYENRMNKGPSKWSRNLVWTASDGNRPSKNDNTHGSSKPPVLGKNGGYVQRSSSVSETRGWVSRDNGSPKSRDCVCKFWKAGNCKRGDQCQFLHSWCCFPGMAMVASLEGHKKELKGIALPTGSDKLFSASSDGTVPIWDCDTGQCVHTFNLQAEAGSLISEGLWVFLGLPNAVKAFNVQTSKDLHLNGVVGQVHAMTVANGMLFAGTSVSIFTQSPLLFNFVSVWKATDTESDPFTYLVTSLEGHHSGQVTCFIVGRERVYSGSVLCAGSQHTGMYNDPETTYIHCHVSLMLGSVSVFVFIGWNYKNVVCSENGSFKVVDTRRQEQRPNRSCSALTKKGLSASTIYHHNFKERGNIFSTQTIGTITIGPGGLLFSGD